MPVNVYVQKNTNESGVNLLRRFTKRVQGSGLIKHAKKLNYYNRPLSEALKKKKRLKTVAKKIEKERLYKLGKI
jgi:ribosomal protein S21